MQCRKHCPKRTNPKFANDLRCQAHKTATPKSNVLDLHQLSTQFSDFSVYRAGRERRLEEKLRRAREALADCAGAWEALRDRIERDRPTPLVAGLREAADRTHAAPERPTPVTVAATDGSQIYPDRHVEPTCFVLNIGRIAFQYGTLERPVLESDAHFIYREDDVMQSFDEVLGALTTEFVSALRDEMELEALLAVAHRARREGRPLVAMADGTLIRWMIRAMRNRAHEEQLIRRYTGLMAQFQRERVPLCSYVSMPANAEMINLLRMHRGEEAPGFDGESLDGLLDRRLFAATLRPGERSATFDSFSHIQAEYDAGDRICYFYVRIPAAHGPGEVARVEAPQWVAEDAGLLGLVHSVVLSEWEKGDGYPMILSEAHERAVIRAPEKERFYRLIEREMAGAGLPFTASRKRASKRRPMV